MARYGGPWGGEERAAHAQTTIAQQIKACDDVLEHLTALDTRDVTDLIEDVRNLRASLHLRVASGDGSQPST